MALELNGTTGVSLVQDGVITDANLPTGSVLQVESSTGSSQVTIGSSSFITLSVNVSITPTSTSSKILVSVSGGEIDTFASNRAVYLSIFRNDSTNLGDAGNGFGSHWGLNSRVQIPMSMEYLDSTSTTNTTTYTVYGRTNSGTAYLNANTVKYTITAMEIAG